MYCSKALTPAESSMPDARNSTEHSFHDDCRALEQPPPRLSIPHRLSSFYSWQHIGLSWRTAPPHITRQAL